MNKRNQTVKDWSEFTTGQMHHIIQTQLNAIKNLTVAVLYGATSAEDKLYMNSKRQEHWSVNDIVHGLRKVCSNAEWIDATSPKLSERLKDFDVAFINTHGEYGEDGHLQGLLAYSGMPYTCSGVATSAIASDKRLTKLVLGAVGVEMPSYLRVGSSIGAFPQNFDSPWMVKAVNGGSSVGLECVRSAEEMSKAVFELEQQGFNDLICEPFIQGRAITVPVLQIDTELVILPPIECIPTRAYYDQHTKLYGDVTGQISYKALTDHSDSVHQALISATKKIVHSLPFEGAFRVDFIVDGNNTPQLLELNTVPGMQRGSNLVLAATAAGIEYEELLGIVLASAASHKVVPWRAQSNKLSDGVGQAIGEELCV